MRKPMISLAILSFLTFLGFAFATTSFAAPPCESGSNDSCSWTCSGGTFNVTCNNPDGPDRCYLVTDGSSQEAKCSDFSPYNPARMAPNPMNTTTKKAKSKKERATVTQ